MIQIDDSGSGSLIGGTCIGALRKETGEYYYGIIPLENYQCQNFEEKVYLDKAVDLINLFLEQLKVSKDEKIEVCRGYMFDNLRPWLREKKYCYLNTKIGEPLQALIEKTFEKYSVELGLPQEFLSYTKYPFHFHRLLRWVYADYNNRVKLCKTGWKSWKKYGSLEIEIKETTLKKSNYKCLKCWKPIEVNSQVTMMKYISNKPNIIYLHHNCN
ncbi:MAG: hypothetical protein KGZ33_05275 [Alkaliphilus sp.]|nr:hypothetical protein [Alkaliphilus sp.]